MTLFATLRAAGGIMRAQHLIDAGWSRHTLDAHRAAGRLMRPQRGWLALPDADRQLVYAAQHGVLLSCMSLISRLGLWVPDRVTRPHVAARTPNSRVRGGNHVCHWAVPVVRREPHRLIDRVENALVLAAGCLPAEGALAVWESALRTETVTRAGLERLPLRERERELLAACSIFSDSGLESYVRRRLTALRLRVVAQAWLYGHRVDFLIEGWLVLQIDGGHHVGPQRTADNRIDAVLAVNGFVTIRVGSWQVEHDWPEVQRLIMVALSQGRPRVAGGGRP